MINIGSNSTLFANVIENAVGSLPDAAFTPENLEAIGQVLRDAYGQSLTESGFPAEAKDYLNNPGERNNADVWDAYVSHMAAHPEDGPGNVAELDAAVAELADNPDADAASLDALVSTMGGTAAGLGGGIKDAMGTNVLQTLNERIGEMLDRVGERMEELGEVTLDQAPELIESASSEVDDLHLQQDMQQVQEMFQTMDSILQEHHDGSMEVIQNLHGDAGDVIEGQSDTAVELAMADADTEVVEGDADGEAFDAYRDDADDAYDTDDQPTYEDNHDGTIA
ncbi:MAG: hypothetical protein RIC56_19870 [Pseudomonadales bacterium]